MTGRDRNSAVADEAQQTLRGASDAEPASIGDVVEFVKTYARQETLGPLKGAGRWIAFGLAGAFAMGLGLFFVLLGVLRMFQTEWTWSARGGWSFMAYLVTLGVVLVFLVLTALRIKKSTLNKQPE